MRYADIGYALLFSLPVGGGVAVATLRATGGDASNPLVVGAGLATALAIFLLVVVAVAAGPDEGDDAERDDAERDAGRSDANGDVGRDDTNGDAERDDGEDGAGG